MKRILSFVFASLLVLSSAALAQGQRKSVETKKGAEAAEKKAPPATADQCAAMTKAGERCKRKAQAGSKYCWQHNKMQGAKGKSETKGGEAKQGGKKQ